MSILNQSPDILRLIFQKLDGGALHNFSTVSKRANQSVWNSKLWVGLTYDSILRDDNLAAIEQLVAHGLQFTSELFRLACQYDAITIVTRFLPTQTSFPTGESFIDGETIETDAYDLSAVNGARVLELLLSTRTFELIDCRSGQFRDGSRPLRCVAQDCDCRESDGGSEIHPCRALLVAIYIGNKAAVQLLLDRNCYAGSCNELFAIALQEIRETEEELRKLRAATPIDGEIIESLESSMLGRIAVLELLAESNVASDPAYILNSALDRMAYYFDHYLEVSTLVLAILIKYERIEVVDGDAMGRRDRNRLAAAAGLAKQI